jgi:2-hydroxy-6-oxo-6-(2'-aminophenyl)hexa-2,4-dienoate hydrolase
MVRMAFKKDFVTVEGVRTHFIEAGEGPILILIHGGGSGADAWGNWSGCLSAYAKNFKVIAVDMPGFGESERPDPARYDYGQTTRNRHMTSFIDLMGGGVAVDVIGNSMGGATALGVTIARPDLVRKLVLMGAAGLNVSNPDPAAKKALGSYDYTPEGMRTLVGFLAGSRFEISDEMVAYRHALTTRPGGREAMLAIHNRLKEDPMTYPPERIASVSCPTLVVGGKEDQVAVLARTYGYLDLIPNSWGFVLPHVGHWVMIEAPEAFVAVTTAFLTGPGFDV